jgi:hypothetical protein
MMRARFRELGHAEPKSDDEILPASPRPADGTAAGGLPDPSQGIAARDAIVCGTTHKTVRRIVEAQLAGGTVATAGSRVHSYDGVVELVARRVRETSGRISAKRLLPVAQADGYDGSARNFCRLVAAQRTLWRSGHHRGRRQRCGHRVSIQSSRSDH